jgi:hypothetical protein
MSVRLACIRHAASVHPEPGSNSPHKFLPSLARGSFIRKQNQQALSLPYLFLPITLQLLRCWSFHFAGRILNPFTRPVKGLSDKNRRWLSEYLAASAGYADTLGLLALRPKSVYFDFNDLPRSETGIRPHSESLILHAFTQFVKGRFGLNLSDLTLRVPGKPSPSHCPR